MMKYVISFLIFIFSLLAASCEHPSIMDEPGSADKTDGQYTIHFTMPNVSMGPFESSANLAKQASAAERVGRISLAVYQNDTKVAQANQDSTSENFGTLQLKLDAGDYKLIAVAHNGPKTATMSTPTKLTFKDDAGHQSVSDTYWYGGDLTVSGDALQQLSLRRVVGKLRFVVEDTIPADVAFFHIVFTGGSSALNGYDGTGATNSTQYANWYVVDHSAGQTFEIYTFPRTDSDNLKIQITAHNSGEEVVHQSSKIETSVPIAVNQVTTLRGSFFSDAPSTTTGNSFSILLDDTEWNETEVKF